MDHFNNVAAVNRWKDEQKLLCLKVRLTRRAQTAFKQLPKGTKGQFEAAVTALGKHFEPQSKCELYVAEFHTRRKRRTEGWADRGEDLRVLADRAFPQLNTEAKQLLVLQQYMGQVDNQQIAFAVKQRHPTTMEEAVAMTIEMESYLAPKQCIAQVKEVSVDQVNVRQQQDTMLEAMADIVSHLERLETQAKTVPSFTNPPQSSG